MSMIDNQKVQQDIICFLQTPGMGKREVKDSTLSLRLSTLSLNGNSGDVTNLVNSPSFVPETSFLASIVISTPSLIKSATTTKSFSDSPLVVIAGVPILIPPGTNALLSPVSHFHTQFYSSVTIKLTHIECTLWIPKTNLVSIRIK